jgi:hypothetical protein
MGFTDYQPVEQEVEREVGIEAEYKLPGRRKWTGKESGKGIEMGSERKSLFPFTLQSSFPSNFYSLFLSSLFSHFIFFLLPTFFLTLLSNALPVPFASLHTFLLISFPVLLLFPLPSPFRSYCTYLHASCPTSFQFLFQQVSRCTKGPQLFPFPFSFNRKCASITLKGT